MKLVRLVPVYLLVLFSCNDKDNLRKYPEEFFGLVDRFVAEGVLRGVDVDVSKLEITFVEETDPPGFCGYARTNPPRVQIKNSDQCWTWRSDIDQEILLFHEFGHALLNHSHMQDTMANGNYKSMMFAGDQFGTYSSKGERRDYYLDELFDKSISQPTWATPQGVSAVVYEDPVAAVDTWNFVPVGSVQGIKVDTTFTNPSYSLAIKSTAPVQGFTFWGREWAPTKNIPEGSKLELRVKIRTVNVTGGAVTFAFRGDDLSHNTPSFFASSYGQNVIDGTTAFKEYIVVANNYPATVDKHFIFLILDGAATGTVFFDEIKVINKY